MVSSAVLEHSPIEEEGKNGQEMVTIKQSKHNFVQTNVEVTVDFFIFCHYFHIMNLKFQKFC
jgi:hypothetical protein